MISGRPCSTSDSPLGQKGVGKRSSQGETSLCQKARSTQRVMPRASRRGGVQPHRAMISGRPAAGPGRMGRRSLVAPRTVARRAGRVSAKGQSRGYGPRASTVYPRSMHQRSAGQGRWIEGKGRTGPVRPGGQYRLRARRCARSSARCVRPRPIAKALRDLHHLLHDARGGRPENWSSPSRRTI
jgi:hypothetical protein